MRAAEHLARHWADAANAPDSTAGARGTVALGRGNGTMANQVEILRGPFDPGGQPETRGGNPLELGFFAWNLAGGMTAWMGEGMPVERG